MVLSSASHKAFLYQRINIEDGHAKSYLLDKLGLAISTSTKLIKDSRQEGETIHFVDGEIDFTAEEWVFLKEILKNIKEATILEGKVIDELKNVLV